MTRPTRLSLIAILALLSMAATTQGAIFQYQAFLDGPTEPSPSPGTGFATVDYDNVAKTLTLNVNFSGLLGNTTVSHIHAATAAPLTGTAGVATPTPTFPGFPSGVTAGSYSQVLNLTLASSYNGAFITANGGTPASAEIALANAMATGRAYWNIHTTSFGGGEIRGFLVPVPEPASIGLLGLGAMAVLVRRRR